MMRALTIITLVAMVLTTVGCETMDATEKGTVSGGIAGAAVGGLVGSKGANAGKGMLVGAIVGTAVGYITARIMESKGEATATAICPNCKSTIELPENAKARDIIDCGSCGKEFILE